MIPDKADNVALDGDGGQQGGDEDEDKDTGQGVVLGQVGHQEGPRHGLAPTCPSPVNRISSL